MTEELPRLLAGPPTPAAQRRLVGVLRQLLEPLLVARGIHQIAFEIEPGGRLRRRYGQCRHFSDGRPARVTLRCTVDDDRARWRQPGALVHTLLHELAHLRYRGHSRAFWRLCRALLDDAARLGLYDPREDDPTERSSGLDKLAGSAAQPLVGAARGARRLRSRAARELLTVWPVGGIARIKNAPRGALSGVEVRILNKRRTRVLVETPLGRRYLVPGHLLEPTICDDSSPA